MLTRNVPSASVAANTAGDRREIRRQHLRILGLEGTLLTPVRFAGVALERRADDATVVTHVLFATLTGETSHRVPASEAERRVAALADGWLARVHRCRRLGVPDEADAHAGGALRAQSGGTVSAQWTALRDLYETSLEAARKCTATEGGPPCCCALCEDGGWLRRASDVFRTRGAPRGGPLTPGLTEVADGGEQIGTGDEETPDSGWDDQGVMVSGSWAQAQDWTGHGGLEDEVGRAMRHVLGLAHDAQLRLRADWLNNDCLFGNDDAGRRRQEVSTALAEWARKPRPDPDALDPLTAVQAATISVMAPEVTAARRRSLPPTGSIQRILQSPDVAGELLQAVKSAVTDVLSRYGDSVAQQTAPLLRTG